MPSVMKHTPFNPVSSVLLVLKKGLHTIHIWDDDNIFRKSVVQCPRAFPRVCPSPRARLGQLLSLWSLPARPRFCFFLFCKVPYTTTWKGCFHIKYKKKMKNATNILFSLTYPPRKKNEIKKILPFDCLLFTLKSILETKQQKKNLPPFYE